METLQNLKDEFAAEYATTKKFLNLLPEGKNEWAPHEKSMKLMPLATHLAEIFGWPEIILKSEKLDFAAGDYQPTKLNNASEVRQKLEEEYEKGSNAVANYSEENLGKPWIMTMGDEVLMDFSKYTALRHALNQITHHRAQLGVYYRLLGIPVPASYGPSADEE